MFVVYAKPECLSMLFGLIASRISTNCASFTIAIRTVFDSNPVGRHEFYHFIFTGFVPTVTFDSMLHNVSLTYIYNAIAQQRVYTAKKIGSEEPIAIFGYKV